MRVRNKFSAAAAAALCVLLAVSVPAQASQAVVGTAPASGAAEETSAAAETASSSVSGSASLAASETGTSRTGAASGAAVEVETGAAPAPETAAPERTAAAETAAQKTAVPSETAASAAPAGTAASAAPSETASAAETAAPPAETTAAQETSGSEASRLSSSAVKPDSDSLQDSGVSDDELRILDSQTGPGVSLVHAGDHGVNEPTVSNPDTSMTTDWSSVSALRKEIVAYAENLAGSKYVFGGDSPESGFDCSGFVMYVMKNAANVNLYHQSAVQAAEGVSVTASEMRPGDLIAYDGVPKDGQVNHIAIYVGDGKAIHAVGTGKGVRVTKWNYANPLTIRNVLGD